VREAAKQRQRGTQFAGKDESGQVVKNPVPVQIREPVGVPKETIEVRAKAAGTNAAYISEADRLLEEEPEACTSLQSRFNFAARSRRGEAVSSTASITRLFNILCNKRLPEAAAFHSRLAAKMKIPAETSLRLVPIFLSLIVEQAEYKRSAHGGLIEMLLRLQYRIESLAC
jgi:hypothetical protein